MIAFKQLTRVLLDSVGKDSAGFPPCSFCTFQHCGRQSGGLFCKPPSSLQQYITIPLKTGSSMS